MIDIIEMSNGMEFKKNVIDYDGVAVVDFWAPWCGPCKQMSRTFEIAAEELSGNVLSLSKLNVDSAPSIAADYGVRAIPTVIIFKAGEVKDVISGLVTKTELLQRIDEVVN